MSTQPSLNTILILAVTLALVLILSVPIYQGLTRSQTGEESTLSLLYASAGSMPQLLNTRQIDAFLAWEPVVANSELSSLGRKIAVPSDLPPPGKWDDMAINVLVLHRNTLRKYPEISGLLSALTTAAIQRTNEDPDPAIAITADWVFGKRPILTPTGALDPLEVERISFANMVFTPSARLPGPLSFSRAAGVGDPVAGISSNPECEEVRELGRRYLDGTRDLPSGSGRIPTLRIGYIPSSDNYAPLYVMVRDATYFCENYGFCLVPDDPRATRPVLCTLYSAGAPLAKVQLVPGQSGGGIMTTIGQGALDGAYVGSYPAWAQISRGNPSCIVQSINTGGSGLVVYPSAPCSDWESFVQWVNTRSAEGKPVVLATIQSSIQEEMVREACAYENIRVVYHGTGLTADGW